MADDCVFCSIVDDEIPSYEVYEDHEVYAFLDANPLAEGHALVIPKAHYETLADLPAALGEAIGRTTTQLAPRIEAAVDADASTVAFNNGEAAGQEVPHVHCHVVPRFEGDGAGPIHALFGARPDVEPEELEAVAADVRERE